MLPLIKRSGLGSSAEVEDSAMDERLEHLRNKRRRIAELVQRYRLDDQSKQEHQSFLTVIDPTTLQPSGSRRFKPGIDMPDFSSEQELTVDGKLPDSSLSKNSGIMLSNQARSKKSNIRITPRQQKSAS